MDNTLDIDETLSKASDFISGGSTLQDYEQAAVLLAQIASVSPVAKDMLDRLAARGLGIECASATNIDYYSGSNQSRLDRLFQDLDPDANRCINCGITGYLMPWRDEALVCDERGGGCGAVQDLVITESGLTKGLGIEPYTPVAGVRSYLGSQINTLKYDASLDSDDMERIITEIANRIRECAIIDRLVPRSTQSDLVVVPAPSSKRRRVQPVYELARAIAGDRFTYAQALTKHTQIESKNRRSGSELAEGEISCKSGFAANNVLLFDDTYGEGATTRACIRALRGNGVSNIFLLTLCKNTFGGIKG
jgi:predicted amidophosphoribosyltransferase